MNVLLALANDLASSIALRYLCNQAEKLSMTIQPFHVQEDTQKRYPLGTGWVRHTWQDTVVDISANEVRDFIANETKHCRGLLPPKIVMGDVIKLTLKEMTREDYFLYAAGILSSFTSSNFYELIRGKLMQKIATPVLLIKNLSGFSSATLLLKDGMDIQKLCSTYLSLYGKADIDVEIIRIDTTKMEETSFKEIDDVPSYVKEAGEILKKGGCRVSGMTDVSGDAKRIGEKLRDRSMIVSLFDRRREIQSPFIDILAYTPASVLIVWS